MNPHLRRCLRAGAAFALLLGAACEPARLPARASINEPQALAFRCVYPNEEPDGRRTGRVTGVPLEGCGCTVRDEAGVVRQMGRVECHCLVQTTVGPEQHLCADGVDNDADGKTDAEDAKCVASGGSAFVEGEGGFCKNGRDDDADGLKDADEPGCYLGAENAFAERRVKRIQAECRPVPEGEDPDCTPVRDVTTGDYVPVFDSEAPENTYMACEAAESGSVRAYVGASGRGEVAVVDVDEDSEIVDVDRSIPGTTAIFVDDLVSDVASDPDGRFVFTVNSSTGSLSVVRHDDVAVAYTVELTSEPLFEATVFPSPSAPREVVEGDSRRLAWLTAPVSGRIYEIDLDVLAAGEADGGTHGAPPGLVRRVIELPAVAGAARAPRPGALSVDADGRWLYVTHRDHRALTAVDLLDPGSPGGRRTVDLGPVRCEDAYLVDVVDLPSVCRNGEDDDGDGLADSADPECQGGSPWEGAPPEDCRPVAECFQVPECENGLDDDADGTIDGCDGRWEGPVPACANGEDDDGDGLADRADPDCQNEADGSENGRELSTCNDGLDNDGDGQIDTLDADCQGERCDDGEDNPEAEDDSLSDTEDPDCRGADAPVGTGLPEEGGGFARQPSLGGETGEAVGDTPCTNDVDDDGDGLTDADDPGCRFFSSARRYGFESVPACGDGLDNDRDGLVDFPQDPDCYAASDNNEGGSGADTGLAEVVAGRLDLGGGVVHRSAYALDRATGEVVTLDFGADTAPYTCPRQRTIDVGGEVQAMALRETHEGAALIVVDQDGALGTVELVGPALAADTEGRPVFAHVAEDADDRLVVTDFYVVEAGTARRIAGLDDYLAETEGRVLTSAQEADIRSGVVPGLLSLPVPTPLQVTAAEEDTEALEGWTGDDAVSPRGLLDPLVAIAGTRALIEARTNVRVTAASRTNRLTGSPSLVINEAKQVFDPKRHPALCRLPEEGETSPGGAVPTCIPVGRDAAGHPEDPDAAEARTVNKVVAGESAIVVEDSVDALPADRFTVSYEGLIPGSDSKSGVFGGRHEAGESLREALWSILDFDRDFCRLGVEPGDVVLIDNFVPVVENLNDLPPECAELAGLPAAYGDPRRYREPIRYRVQSLTAHRLVLGQDPPPDADGNAVARRTTYEDQVPLDPRLGLPQVPPSPPAPAAQCAAQFIRYHIRARDEQWLLAGDRTGLRHPWVNQDGLCVRHPDRADRSGRVTLGQPFENEWLRFTLGWLAQTDPEVDGVPEGKRPYQLDARYELITSPGRQYNGVVGEILLPRRMYWLPVDDRLYVVDTAISTIAEFTGFDPYQNRTRLVRRYD